jgi:hypothetical protein
VGVGPSFFQGSISDEELHLHHLSSSLYSIWQLGGADVRVESYSIFVCTVIVAFFSLFHQLTLFSWKFSLYPSRESSRFLKNLVHHFESNFGLSLIKRYRFVEKKCVIKFTSNW